MNGSFIERREHYARSLARAGFHPHQEEGEATRTQLAYVAELAAKGGVPASYAKLAERRVLDKDEASQVIEAANRFLARRKRGMRVPFQPCESRSAVERRLRRAMPAGEQLSLSL